jgi:NAD(P)H-dependent flavin oxidoreductase YrpB (nitropropane dioxygenase family)
MASLPEMLGVDLPVFAAPMAGGPGTPGFVIAAGRAGSMGFLAGGYKTPQALAAELTEVDAASVPYGVNLFAPNPLPVDVAEFRRYAAAIAVEAARYRAELDVDDPTEDDDGWPAKIDVLRAHPVPLVSFTFGIPAADAIATLKRTGALLVQTVTSVDEARAAADVGIDALAVQASVAGGHSGTLTPLCPLRDVPLPDLVAAVHRAVALPVIAAGGVVTAEQVAAVLTAGADAVAVGTALLRSDEAGTSEVHRAAVADPSRTATVVTHAFTGRPARGIRNEFIDAYDRIAPYGYPALHHLTSAIRKAAAAAGDPERVHLWAGTGFRQATAEPVATILHRLASSM